MAIDGQLPIDTTNPCSSAVDNSIVNESASSPPPSPARKPPNLTRRLLHSLVRRLLNLLRTFDRILLRLSALLSSPTTTDNLLCTTSYTLHLVHALTKRLLTRRLQALASSIASKTDGLHLLPGETLVATIPAPRSTQLLRHVQGVAGASSALIGDFRIFVRLWGLVGVYTWGRDVYRRAPLAHGANTGAEEAEEKVKRALEWAQVASCAGFQILENGAFLSSNGVLGTFEGWSGSEGKKREGKWWIWSSRFWALYVGLEIVRLGVAARYQRLESAANSSEYAIAGQEQDGSGLSGEKEEKLALLERQRQDRRWWRDVISNLAYAPMTLHWSVADENGFLADWGIGCLGAVAGGANLVEAWKATGRVAC